MATTDFVPEMPKVSSKAEDRRGPLINADPHERWNGPRIDQHDAKVAAAHEADRQRNLARQTPKPERPSEAEENTQVEKALRFQPAELKIWQRRLKELAELRNAGQWSGG